MKVPHAIVDLAVYPERRFELVVGSGDAGSLSLPQLRIGSQPGELFQVHKLVDLEDHAELDPMLRDALRGVVAEHGLAGA